MVALGTFLASSLIVGDGIRALQTISLELHGGGVNAHIPAFAEPIGAYLNPHPIVLVLALSLLGAVVGVARRDPRPLIWFSGVAVVASLAAARDAVPSDRYFALAYVLAIPRRCRSFRRRFGSRPGILVWLLVLYVVVPTFEASGHDVDGHAPAAVGVVLRAPAPAVR